MFYQKLKEICEAKGVKISHLISDIGISSANMTSWKNGRTPKVSIIKQIAEYLGVSVYELLETEEPPEQDEMDKIKFAFFGTAKGITDEMLEDVRRYAQFIKEKYGDTEQ